MEVSTSTFVTLVLFIATYIPAIVYMRNPRKLRRLFQQKVKYWHNDERGNRIQFGYIIGWTVRTEEIRTLEALPKMKLKDLKNHKPESLISPEKVETIHKSFVIVESALPHPDKGYQIAITDVSYVEFL